MSSDVDASSVALQIKSFKDRDREFDIILKSGRSIHINDASTVVPVDSALRLSKSYGIPYTEIYGFFDCAFWTRQRELPSGKYAVEIMAFYAEDEYSPEFLEERKRRRGQGQQQQQQQQQQPQPQYQHQTQQQQHQQIEIVYLAPSRATIFYVDWKYMAQLEGGLKGLGLSYGFGLSTSWQKSLWSSVQHKLSKPTAQIGAARHSASPVLKAFPLPVNQQEIMTLEMEGERWRPIYFSFPKFRTSSSMNEVDWLLAYYRPDCVSIDIGRWETLSEPMNIMGEFVEARILTPHGPTAGLLKLRAAAFLP